MSRSRPDSGTTRILRCSNRNVTQQDVGQIRQLLAQHPDWGRQELSLQLCRLWGWYRSDGTLQHRVCLSLLQRLAAQGHIVLPAPKSNPRRTSPPPSPVTAWQPNIDTGSIRLEDLSVRPVRFDEKPRWRQLIEQFHYLGFRGMVGESIGYVATVVGHTWVALLAWSAPALKSRHREAWIGWNPSLKERRLHLLANNSRFLVLPGFHIKNLASKVLALNLQRLSRDWQARYGHPILLAETFVDISRFHGTCYRAAGWIPLGLTRGFGKRRTGYIAHGQPKMLLVRPLHPRAVPMLSAPFSPPRFSHPKENLPMIDVNRLPLEGNDGLIDLLKTLTDPRKPRGVRHPISCIVAIATCACLSGARSFEGIAQWASELSREAFKRLGGTRRKPPSEKTFRLVLQRLDAVALDGQIGAWMARHNLLSGKAIAVDGKTLCGAHDGDRKAPHLLSAILHQEGIFLAQQPVGDKTNEIPCIKPLLDDLNIQGAVVTADALHTQIETARYLVADKKADYVFTVKDNQPTLRQDIEDLHLEAFPPSAHGNL